MKRILIIEDDVAILRGLKDNLEYESYEVLTAEDGEKGYCLILEKKPDLIILDLMLPKMSGYELCRKVRDNGITTPILMLVKKWIVWLVWTLGLTIMSQSPFRCRNCWQGSGPSFAVFKRRKLEICQVS